MMTRLFIVATCLVGLAGTSSLVACTDPSLEVHFAIPDDYQSVVQSAALSIIVPPEAAPFDCDDIAFATVSNEVVQANTVEGIVLRESSQASLNALPREGLKLLLAKGFSEDGQEVVAGCVSYGTITEGENVTIVGEVVTSVSVPALSQLDVATELSVSDFSGKALSGIEVRWVRTAPGAEIKTESKQTNNFGQVSILVEQPVLPGPVAVDVFVKWSRDPPPVLNGFKSPKLVLSMDVPDRATDSPRNSADIYQVGRIGPNGEVGGAVVTGADPMGVRRVLLVYIDSNMQIVSEVSEDLPTSANTLALVKGEVRDRLFVVSPLALFEVSGSGAIVRSLLAEPAGLVRRLFTIDDCTDSPAPLLLAVAGEMRAIDEQGKFVDSPFADPSLGTPIASGCLSEGETLRRVVVYSSGDIVNVVAQMNVVRSGLLGVVPSGIAFSNVSADSDALLLATALSISGTKIGRYRLRPTGDSGLNFELVTSDATLTFGRSIASGDFDGDGLTDIAAIMVFGDMVEASSYRFHVALGLEAATGRVSGVSPPQTDQRPRLFVRDFNGDGYDDIIVGSNLTFQVFSMGPL